MKIQFRTNMFPMGVDRGGTDGEFRGDFTGGSTESDQFENSCFRGSQRRQSVFLLAKCGGSFAAFQEVFGEKGAEEGATACDGLDTLNHTGRGVLLQEVTLHPSRNRGLEEGLLTVGGQDDGTRLESQAPDLLCNCESGSSREVKVENRHGWPFGDDFLKRQIAIRHFSNDSQGTVRGQDLNESSAEYRVIIGHYYRQGGRHGGECWNRLE